MNSVGDTILFDEGMKALIIYKWSDGMAVVINSKKVNIELDVYPSTRLVLTEKHPLVLKQKSGKSV